MRQLFVRMFPPVPAMRVAFANRDIQSGAPRGKALALWGGRSCRPAVTDWIEWGQAEQGILLIVVLAGEAR